jgi:hypothetical protein
MASLPALFFLMGQRKNPHRTTSHDSYLSDDVPKKHAQSTMKFPPAKRTARWRVPNPSASVFDSVHFEEYLRRCGQSRSDWRKKLARTDVDLALFDAEEVIEVVDPIYQEYSEHAGLFNALCGFSVRDFDILYDLMSSVLDVQRRGRHRVIGPRDSLLIFLNWLRTANSMATISQSLRICEDPLYRPIRELIHLVHDPLVNQFITSYANAPLTAGEAFPC